MFQSLKVIFLGVAVASISACGGGGGGGDGGGNSVVAPPANPILSVTQQNFESSAIKDSWVDFNWNMPATFVAPTSGTHYFYAENFSLPTSPVNGAVDLVTSPKNYATTLVLPNMAKQGVTRVVKNGAIFANNHLSRNSFNYVGNDVVENIYASDGTTLMAQIQYDSWSAPIPLAGPIATHPILKSFYSFANNSSNFFYNLSKSWLSGASYVTRKSFYTTDTLFARDWIGKSYTSDVVAYPGTETTLEDFFSSPTFLSSSGPWDVLPQKNLGTITTLAGVRTWIAWDNRASSAEPTDEHMAFFELNGKIYYGAVVWAGTRIRSIDGMSTSTTVINDYSIRLNSAAGDSIRPTLKF